jgi:hypothetical protein
MPASEAQLIPNATERGPTGEGVALSIEDAAEVDRTIRGLEADFRPTGDVGRVLVRRLATRAVRMERGVLQETAALNERVAKARAEAVAHGEDPDEAGCRAMFDPSKEAALARRYEAAAERGFFRALKELRLIEEEARGPDVKSEAAAIRKQRDQLASSFPAADRAPAAVKPALATPPAAPKPGSKPAPTRAKTVFPAWKPAFAGPVDVPITIGRAR